MIRSSMYLSILVAAGMSSGGVEPPVPKTAIRFQGDRLLVVPGKTLSLDNRHLTVAAWVKFDDTRGSQVFLNRDRADSQFTFYLFRDRIRFLIRHRPDAYLHANMEAPAPGTWIHLAGSYDGQDICLYRNGILIGRTPAPGHMAPSNADLFVGSLNDYERFFRGEMADIRLWTRTLNREEIAAVARGEETGPLDKGLLARWTERDATSGDLISQLPGKLRAESRKKGSMLINGKAEGFRGIWYYNQPSHDEYVYKYSGGLGTYCAKHIPMAWYAPAVKKTFFVFGGTDANNSTLLHMVSFYDHRSGLIARPTILLDKKTTDAHDNPVLNLDDQGYLWIFSSSHGTARPSYICRSTKPYSIERFELVWTGNFSYPQPFFFPKRGFLFLHTHYADGRTLCLTTSRNGKVWTPRVLLSHIGLGHYQISFPWKEKMGTAFNMHPRPQGLNWRTNLYYMESEDFGKTWRSASGTTLDMPLAEAKNPALVHDYAAEGLKVYMKDLNYDSRGNPIILYITSKGYESGPENMPRTWTTAHWNGNTWEIRGQIVSDSNYDTGCLHVESDTTWRIIGPTETGPQPYNPGGEMAMWLTRDAGASWTRVARLTHDSPYNHTYARRPVNAQPEFYAFWADGNARKPSASRLYFCTRDGKVFRMPVDMHGQNMSVPEALTP